MEIANAFGHGNGIKKVESGAGDDDSACKEDVLIKIGNYGKKEDENEEKTSSFDHQFKDLSCSKVIQGDELLESTRVEMGEVMEENQRLKMSLNKIMKDYETLRMQFIGTVQQDHEKIKLPEETDKETELVSLSLGRFPIKKDDKGKETNNELPLSAVKENLSLGLDCKFEQETKAGSSPSPNRSLTNSYDQEGAAKEEAGETWPPSKAVKHMRSGEDSEVTQNNPPKKARVCVRARCETTTMNDGCQWRKYGQKIAKGNPCPRAYYRCTGSPTCPVRKQVQRCADDMSILITTYEGNHNHPLAVSATAMASTTSAAVSMLLSGSSSSSSISTPSSVNLQGLNFYLSGNNNNNNNLNLKQFYLPNSSISSASPTHPTITLDLTSSIPSSSSSSTSSSSHFSKFPNPRYPFTSNLDFGSSRNNNNNNNVLSWNNNNNNSLISYTNNQALYNRNYSQIQNYLQKNNVVSSSTDTIAAATKAITADPSFQSALAAALTSIIGNGGERLKSQAPFQLSTYGNNHQMMKGNGSMVFNNVPSNGLSLPFSTSKSASASPAEHIDLTN